MSAQHNEAQPPISHCYARRTPSAVSSPPEPVAGRVSPLRCAVESRRVGGVRRQNPCRALDSARIGSGRTVLRPVHVRYPRRPSLTAVAALELTAAADATSNANARRSHCQVSLCPSAPFGNGAVSVLACVRRCQGSSTILGEAERGDKIVPLKMNCLPASVLDWCPPLVGGGVATNGTYPLWSFGGGVVPGARAGTEVGSRDSGEACVRGRRVEHILSRHRTKEDSRLPN